MALGRSSGANDAWMIASEPGVNRQRTGGEQRAADALQRPRADEHADVGGQAAQRRGQREPDHPDHEHAAPAEPVAERAAEQDQPGQGERVGGDRPLQAGQGGVQALADGGQGHVDHGAVQHRHAGPEHGSGEHPPPPCAGQADGTRRWGHR
jgi:hypothetical protein